MWASGTLLHCWWERRWYVQPLGKSVWLLRGSLQVSYTKAVRQGKRENLVQNVFINLDQTLRSPIPGSIVSIFKTHCNLGESFQTKINPVCPVPGIQERLKCACTKIEVRVISDWHHRGQQARKYSDFFPKDVWWSRKGRVWNAHFGEWLSIPSDNKEVTGLLRTSTLSFLNGRQVFYFYLYLLHWGGTLV